MAFISYCEHLTSSLVVCEVRSLLGDDGDRTLHKLQQNVTDEHT
ncbi:MAG: hypothetical protein V7K35_03255 [Nostoc sp.]